MKWWKKNRLNMNWKKIYEILLIDFQDCHGTGGDNTIPVQDDTQNVLAEEGYQNGTHTQIVFRRPLETCDPHDCSITVRRRVNFPANESRLYWEICLQKRSYRKKKKNEQKFRWKKKKTT